MSQDKSTLNSEEIKPIALAVNKLSSYACLKVSAGQSVSQSDSQSVENLLNKKFKNFKAT